MCITLMHAQVSMLIKHHQLMVKYHADHIYQALLHLTRHTSLVTNVN